MKTKIVGILVCMLLSTVILSGVTINVGADDWPQFRHDPARLGNSSSPAPNTNNVLWSYEMDGETYSSPAVVNGRIYFAEYGGVGGTDGLTCLDSISGDFEWQFEVGDIFQSSPAVVDDGSVFDGVYFVGYDNYFTDYTDIWALELDGGFKWKYPIGYDHSFVASSPAVVDGKVYAYTSDNNYPSEGKLHCLDAEGDQSFYTTTEYWNFTLGGYSQSSPVVADGKVYMLTGWPEYMLYCIDANDGTEIWTHYIENFGKMSPAVVNGKVYVGSQTENKLFCLDALGNGDGTTFEHWNYSTSASVVDSPAVADGKVYFRSDKLYCLNAEDGSFIWSHEGVSNMNSFPAVADGKVYVGSTNKFYCLDAEGNGDGTTTEIWNYICNNIYNSPSVADGKVYLGIKDTNNDFLFLCFRDPPEIPNQLDGSTSGLPGVNYSFTTVTTDPLGDQLYYMWDWDDGTELVWDGPYGSGVIASADHIWPEIGGYEIRVKAKNTDGVESDWSSAFSVTIATEDEMQQLVISAPSSVVEEVSFDVTVTSNGNFIENALVVFNGKTYTTDFNGLVSIPDDDVPTVIEDKDYTVIATKEGYVEGRATTTVLNKEEDEPSGWIWGTVIDDSSSVIQNAEVCIEFPSEGPIVTTQCTFTNENGIYTSPSLPVGTYTVQVSKPGYKTITENVIVYEGEATDYSFELIKKTDISSKVSLDEKLIQQYIDTEIENLRIGAEIGVAFPTEEDTTIQYYSDELTIELNSTEEIISFTVSAENGTNGTILVIRIGEGVLEDLDNLNVTYDGVPIDEIINVEEFFNIQGNTTLGWLRFLTTTGLHLFIRVPEFSEHTITISSLAGIIEVVTHPEIVLILATMVIIIAAFVMFRKGKED